MYDNLFFYTLDIQFSQNQVLKETCFPHFVSLIPLQKINCIWVGLFLGSLLYSIGLLVCFYVSTILFDHYSFVR